jgi:GT2 family glycosyltransferase
MGLAKKSAGLTVAIPTYCREHVLVQTVHHFLSFDVPTIEILVLDQSACHIPEVESELSTLHARGQIRLFKLNEPSIPRAMNSGLIEASHDLVLFVDDDIIPEAELIRAHLDAHALGKKQIIAGRVIQPWQEGVDLSADGSFHFASLQSREIDEFMGGNFSLDRQQAIALGGFDENFVRVAYRFEAEFAYRWRAAGYHIMFEPKACIHHLKVPSGGTRTFGNHLITIKPDHSVGAYYFCLRTRSGSAALKSIVRRLIDALATRYHLKNPWRVPPTLISEIRGFIWACRLAWKGPRYTRGGPCNRLGPRPEIAKRRGAPNGQPADPACGQSKGIPQDRPGRGSSSV